MWSLEARLGFMVTVQAPMGAGLGSVGAGLDLLGVKSRPLTAELGPLVT